MKIVQQEKIREHFQKVFDSVQRSKSKLGERQEELYSLAGIPMKHLVNTLCEYGTVRLNYLELGPYRGATLVCAVWQNKVNAYAVDNFKYDATAANRQLEDFIDEDGKTHEVYHPNIETHLHNSVKLYKESWKGDNEIKIIRDDINTMSLEKLDKKFDIVFHDADKKDNWAEKFLVKFKPVLDKYCILAFTKAQDVGAKGKIENALKNNGYFIIEKLLIPDTDIGLDGRSAVLLYYVENRETK